MPVMQIEILPLGTGATSVSGLVAGAVRIIRDSGLKYVLTPMSTVVEGELGELLELCRKVHEAPFSAGAQRVVTIITIDDRRDKPVSISGKVAAVEEKLE